MCFKVGDGKKRTSTCQIGAQKCLQGAVFDGIRVDGWHCFTKFSCLHSTCSKLFEFSTTDLDRYPFDTISKTNRK